MKDLVQEGPSVVASSCQRREACGLKIPRLAGGEWLVYPTHECRQVAKKKKIL